MEPTGASLASASSCPAAGMLSGRLRRRIRSCLRAAAQPDRSAESISRLSEDTEIGRTQGRPAGPSRTGVPRARQTQERENPSSRSRHFHGFGPSGRQSGKRGKSPSPCRAERNPIDLARPVPRGIPAAPSSGMRKPLACHLQTGGKSPSESLAGIRETHDHAQVEQAHRLRSFHSSIASGACAARSIWSRRTGRGQRCEGMRELWRRI